MLCSCRRFCTVRFSLSHNEYFFFIFNALFLHLTYSFFCLYFVDTNIRYVYMGEMRLNTIYIQIRETEGMFQVKLKERVRKTAKSKKNALHFEVPPIWYFHVKTFHILFFIYLKKYMVPFVCKMIIVISFAFVKPILLYTFGFKCDSYISLCFPFFRFTNHFVTHFAEKRKKKWFGPFALSFFLSFFFSQRAQYISF